MRRRLLHVRRRVLMLSLASVMVVTGAWATTTGVAAAGPTTAVTVPSPSVVEALGAIHLTPDQVAQANQKLGFISDKGIWSEFSLVNGTLATIDPLGVIKVKYGLNADQLVTIQGILNFAKHDGPSATTRSSGDTQPMVFLNGTVIYLTYSDMVGLLFTAATLGPAALAAAINAMGWMFGGPIGGAVALIMSIVGIATIAGLAYLIIQAHVLHQGIYFGITWNWIFPNYTQGTWCGCN